MKILGEQHGVELVPRGEGDPHCCIQLLAEDDENWFENGSRFSSFWLDDLIQVLEQARDAMKKMPDDPSGFGKILE